MKYAFTSIVLIVSILAMGALYERALTRTPQALEYMNAE